MSKRKRVEELILSTIKELVTGNENVNLYKELFASMNDKEFHSFMLDIKSGKKTLCVIIPNGSNIKVDINNNIKIAKKLGFNFFQKLVMSGHDELPDNVTPNEYLIIKLPIKRAAQLLSKKISVPDDDKSVDTLTGQVTGKSRSSKLTLPEVQILAGLGLKNSIQEMMTLRGGDQGANNAFNLHLYKQGMATQAQSLQYSTGVTSTKTLNSYFNAMHIRTTL